MPVMSWRVKVRESAEGSPKPCYLSHVQSATNYCLPWAALRNIGRCAQWTVQTGGQYSTDIICTFIYYLLSSIPVGTGTYF